MDEVDIDNAEDLNELEAHLYAQIHHEATKQDELPQNENCDQVTSNNDTGGINSNYETAPITPGILSKRYWANGEKSAQHQQNVDKHHFIRNPFKTPNKQSEQHSKNYSREFFNKSQSLQQSEQSECRQSGTAVSTVKNNENVKNTPRSSKAHAVKCTTPPAANENTPCETTLTSNETLKKKSFNKKNSGAANVNLKLNPVAEWMKRNKNQTNKKSNINSNNGKNIKNSASNNKQGGPFTNKLQKLQKAKRLEEKKQKTRRAKNKAAANKIKLSEIIDLDTDNESDSSDVVLIPTAPPPTFTVDDSGDDDENENGKVTAIMEDEENALDSTDVQMSSTSTSFVKPQTLVGSENVEKRLENSSRCTSPCSIQSSDDFIGQNDRSRLLAKASGIADDEDLLVLTNDMNSFLEVSQTAKPNMEIENHGENEINRLDSSLEQVSGEENIETNDSLEFATPTTSKEQARPKDYRVDQGQFRALDVYESESDITDSVYSKGANKTTVIRQIDTSSDEVEDISSCLQRTKRFRKRRASSSNKDSEPNIENLLSTSDNDDNSDKEIEQDDNEVLRTAVPFISRGPAVEHSKSRKRSRNLFSCSPILQKRKCGKLTKSTGHMSDTAFIATLNNLAQGQEKELADQDEADESETENIPSARDIAEKVLLKHNVAEERSNNELTSKELAIPDKALEGLDKIFEAIDQLCNNETEKTRSSSPDDTVKIDDSSDSDREKNFKYKSTPYDDEAQFIEIMPNASKITKLPPKTHDDNGSPIYNVIYSRGYIKPGGIGWNDEMRRFYNYTWNGESFKVNKILQKMNPDKNLWKIYTEDRFNIKSNKRQNNMKCTNCCEFGHMRSKCKRPKKPMICYMCGDCGHMEPRCPNTICLRCGNKTLVFTKSCNACSYQDRLICPICKIRGHSLDYCPDKWRRYHSTTEPNAYPNNNINYNPRKYCCICGGSGHLSDNCRSAIRFMEYPSIVSNIKSHQKSYDDVVVKSPYNGIALNLMHDPCKEYTFDFARNSSFNSYYGRFLKAVHLDCLLKSNTKEVTIEEVESTAKKAKRLSKMYVANPYSKAGTANQRNTKIKENAPNQVQEISESGKTDEQDGENNADQGDGENNADQGDGDNNAEQADGVEVDNSGTAGSDKEVEFVVSAVNDNDMFNIQLNTINGTSSKNDENFKSPKNVTSTNSETEPIHMLDSDSNYSFSEHFDVPSTAMETETAPETDNISQNPNNSPLAEKIRTKPREMEALPDYIPLIDSIQDNNEQISDYVNPALGISGRFVTAVMEDELELEPRNLSPLPDLPCEAKIYLTHLHSKYLLSPVGKTFLLNTSRAHKLKARLDFTSVGHVLVIFGLPINQDKFQRELLLKYREVEAARNQKQVQSNLNVPKRIDVLIRFLRENITQLLKNLGNVNHLLKCLQFLEKQQSKSSYKLAEKVRRSLNMILVGQAGLQDGTMHLDKLLVSLKTLINDYGSEDVTPPQLRTEITNHWKVIFSSYRHNNYQQLVNVYNKLIMKNRMPKLVIDPILLGQKILDTSLTDEQKQKLEQTGSNAHKSVVSPTTEAIKEMVPNPVTQKIMKPSKRKQNTGVILPSSKASNNVTTQNTNKTKATNSPVSPANATTHENRTDNNSQIVETKSTSNCSTISSTSHKSNKTSSNTSIKAKISAAATTPAANKSKQIPITTSTPINTAVNGSGKKQSQKIVPIQPLANPEKRSRVSTTIQELSDKWKSTCDSLLTEISADKPTVSSDSRPLDSKLPSTFWSRESIRYLDECVRLAAARPHVIEKLQRVQNKSKNGQLSYNDYLAVIKLHTALKGK